MKISLTAERIGAALLVAILGVGLTMMLRTAQAENITSQVVVGNSTPSVASVVLNNNSNITLTANATTAITVSFQVTDNNGCADVFTSGNVTTTVYRVGVTSEFNCTEDNVNCYRVSTTTQNGCAGGATANATATVGIYYFAQATDASSSFPASDWVAHVLARDAAVATGSATSTHRELNTLTAVDVTTSSINYGTISANSDTGSTNQTATTTNAGNSSTTLRLRAQSTLVSGSNTIATSSQRYATSSFTFPGGATQITESNVTVTGFLLTSPTSTANVSRATFWGLEVAAGTATGTYSGTTVFTELFQP